MSPMDLKHSRKHDIPSCTFRSKHRCLVSRQTTYLKVTAHMPRPQCRAVRVDFNRGEVETSKRCLPVPGPAGHSRHNYGVIIQHRHCIWFITCRRSLLSSETTKNYQSHAVGNTVSQSSTGNAFCCRLGLTLPRKSFTGMRFAIVLLTG